MRRGAIGRRMAHKCLVLLVVALSTSRALAGPLTDSTAASEQCSELCPASSNNKFAFDADQTYQYDYESDVKTSMGGASEEHSSLHLRATANIEVISKCEMALRMTDVSMQDSNPSNYESREQISRSNQMKEALEARILRFSFVDGHVASICAGEDEPVWVLNIKRGILSAFQNTMDSLDTEKRGFETDVAGTCPTEYEYMGKSWSTRTVKKTKDLLGCVSRNGPQSAFQGSPFQVASDIQTLPIMKSSHECEQQINGAGIISQSICKEVHVFRPFSRQENGAKTEVTTKLVFNKQIDGVSRQRAGPTKRSELLFDHTLTAEEQEENVRKVKETLNNLCAQSENDVRPDVPSLFATFVREIRKLETGDLKRLFNVATKGMCPNAEKFFRDAIPLIGTEASVNLIRDLIQKGKASENEISVWMTSIAQSIRNPSKAMITAIEPMLGGDASRRAYLAISSLINNYCSTNPGCDSDGEIQGIIRLFTQKLRTNGPIENSNERDEMMAALKAIGNAGHAESAATSLIRCAANTELDMEMRVTALQAFRRMPCYADKTELFNLIDNTENDSELRIHVYLVLMACPEQMVLDRVVRILENEPVNQVGSFIWTHLTNLQETASPHKQQIRAILEKESLKKTFDLDKRKFSRNIEMSLFSELLNMGGSVESNIIFSEKSFIPRSAMLNLTAELFGQSVNFFELGGRLQGMEQILEKFFGPEAETKEGREKRTVIRENSIDMLDRTFDAERDQLGLSYFVRMFGNEIKYGDLHNFDLSNMKDHLNFLEVLINLANDHDFEVTKSMMFLDLTHVIPTASGMPLKLEADGAATVNVKVNGKMDIRRMMTSPSTFDISGSVKPSAALEITSQMGIDAFVARTGLKMVTTLHTSTVAQGKFQLADSRIFNFDWDIPQDKMEIISAESKFFVVWREDEREQKMLNTGDRTSHAECLGGKFTQVFGLEVCGEVSYPWDESRTENVPFFPFNGPFMGKIYLNKRDTYSGFHFDAKYVQEKTRTSAGVQRKDIARVQFNTPGSQIDRELLVDFELDRANMQVTLNMKSPWKKADLHGAIVNTNAVRSLSARAMIDEDVEYSINAQLSTQEDETTTQYIPDIQVVIPGRENIVLDGSVILRQTRKADINVSLKNLFSQPINVRGSIDKINNRRRMKYDAEMEINSAFLIGKVEGFVDHNKASGQSLASRATFEYSYMNGAQQSIVLSNKIRDKSADGAMSYSFDSAWRSSYWPRYDGEVSLDFNYGNNMVSTNFQGGLDEIRRIIISETATFDISKGQATINGNARFQFPLKYMDYEVKAEHMHNNRELKTKGTFKSGDDEGSLTLGLVKESTAPLKMTGEAKLVYPGRDFAWTQSIEETNPMEYHHVMDIQLQKYENIHLDSVYKKTPIHDLSATLTIPEFQPMTLNARLNPDTNNMLIHLDTTVVGNTYSGEVSNTIRGDFRPNFAVKNALSLSWPGREVEAKSQVIRRADIVSVNAQSSLDSDKITVNSQMTLSNSSPAFQVKVTWPESFIGFDFEGAYQQNGWYNTENDLQGRVHFTSSFVGLEDLSAALKHDLSIEGIKTSTEFSWAADKKTDASFSLRKINGFNQVETAIEISTPFTGFRMAKGELNYNLQGNTFQSSTKMQLENQVSELILTGEASLSAEKLIKGSLTFTSPFVGFESITATAKHTDNGRNYATRAEVQWAEGKKITTRLTMQNARTGYSLKNSGEMTVITPFQGYRQTTLTWNHQNDDSKIAHQSVLECENSRSSFEVDAMVKSSRTKHTWEVKSLLQTPFAIASDMRLNIVHSAELYTWRNIKSEGTVQWAPGKSVSFDHEMDADSGLLNMKSKLINEFIGIISVDLRNTIQDNSYAFTNELHYGDNKKISFESSGAIEGTQMSGIAEINTPCPYLEKVVMRQTLNSENGIWVSSSNIEYAPGKIIVIEGQLGLESVKMFGLSLKTPFEYARDVSFSTSFEGTGREFEFKTEVNHDLLAEKIALLLKFDSTNLMRISGVVDFQSPYAVIPFAKVNFVHFRNNAGKIHNKLSVEVPQYQGSIVNDMRVRGWQMHSSRSQIEYIQGQVIDIAHDFSVEDKIEGKLVLKTPFAGMRSWTIDFDHEGPVNDFKTIVVFNYNGFVLNSETNFKLEGTSLEASSKIETSYNLIALTLSHNGDYRQFSNNAAINFNGKQLTASSEFAFNNYEPAARLTIATPYEILKSLNFNLAHAGKNWRNFENNAAFEFNGDRYTADSEFKWFGKLLRLSGKVNLPEEYSIRVMHKGESTDFVNNVVINAFNSKGQAKTAFKLGSNELELSSVIRTPFSGYESFEMKINHEGPSNDFRSSAVVKTPFASYDNVGYEISHQNQRSNVRCTVKLMTPCPAAPVMLFALNHQADDAEINTVATTEYAGKTIEASSLINLRNGASGTLRLSTPYNGFENFVASFSHDSTKSSANLELPFQGYEKMSIESTHSIEGTGMHLTGEFKSDIVNFNSIKVVINHAMPSRDACVSSLVLESSHPGLSRIAASIDHRGNWAQLRSSGLLETPYTNFERFSYNLNHDTSNVRSMKSVGDVNLPIGTFGYSATFNGYPSKFKAVAAITSPFDQHNRYELSVDHTARSSMENKVRFATPSGEFTSTLNHQGNLKDFTSSIVVTSPFNGHERYGFTVSNEATTSIETTAEASLPMGAFTLRLNHQGDYSNMNTRVEVTTPINGHNRYQWNLDHSATDFSRIESSSQLVTPYGDGSISFKHTGVPSKFESSLSLTTPFEGYNVFNLAINHDCSPKTRAESSVRLTSSIGDYSAALNYDGVPRSMSGSLALSSPQQRIQTTFSHNIPSWTEISASAELSMSTDRYSYSLNHQGTLTQFESTFELNTPCQTFPRLHISLENASPSLKAVSLNGRAETKEGEFNLRLSNQIEPSSMNAAIKILTPIVGYEEMSLAIHQSQKNIIISNLNAKVGQKSAGYDFTFSGRNDSFTSRVGLKTPIVGYEDMSAEIEHRYTDLTNVISKSSLNTPVGVFKHELNLSGRPRDLNANFVIDTPFQGYERMSAKIEHTSTDMTNINCKSELNTPVGIFKHVFALSGRPSDIRAALTIETPFDGYSKMSAKIENSVTDKTNVISKSWLNTPVGDFNHEFVLSGRPSDISARLAIETPFTGYDRMTAQVEYTITDSTNVISKSELIIPVGIFKHDFALSGRPSDIRSSLTIETPFDGYNRMSAKIENAVTDSKIVSKSELSISTGVFKHDFTLSGNTRLRMAIETPFEGYQRMSADIDHVVSDMTNVISKSELNTPAGVFKHDFTLSGSPTDIKGSLTIETPFDGYNRMSAKIENAVSDKTNVVSKSELNTPVGVFKHDFALSGRPSDIKAALTIETPFDSYKRMSAKFENAVTDKTNVVSKSELNIPVGVFKYDLTLSGSKANLVIETPYDGYRQMSAQVDHAVSDLTNAVSRSELNTPFGIFKHDFTLSGSPSDIRSSLTIETPFEGYNQMSAKIENAVTDKTNVVSKSELNTPVGVFKHDFALSGRPSDIKAALTIETPFDSYKRMSAKFENAVTDNTNVVSKSELNIPVGLFQHEFTLSGRPSDIKGSLTVMTPFEGYRRMSANIENTISDLTNAISKVELNTPVGIFKHDFILSGRPSDIRASLTIETPFEGYNRMSGKIENAVTNNSIVSKSELNIPVGEFKHEFTLSGNIRAKLTLQTPFEGYRQMSAKIDHTVSDMTNAVSKSELNTPFGIFKHDFTLSGSPSDIRSSLTIETPFEGYNRMSAKIENAITDKTNIVSKSELSTPIGIFKHDFVLSGRPTDIKSSLTVETPFDGYSRMSAKIENTITDKTNIVSKSELSTPVGIFKHDFTLSGKPKDIKANLVIETPFEGYNRMSAKIENDIADLANIVSKGELNIPFGLFKHHVTFSGRASNFRAFATFNTFGGSIEHSHADLSNIKSVAEFNSPRGDFGYSLKYDGTPARFTSSFSVKTPLTGYERMSVALSHDGNSKREFESNINLALPSGEFGGRVRHQGTASRFTSSGAIRTPFTGFESLSITVEHNGASLSALSSSMTYDAPVGQFRISFSNEGRPEDFTTTFGVATPFKGYEMMSASVQHKSNDNSRVTLNIPSGAFSINLRKQDAESTLSLHTPFKGYERMSASLRHSADSWSKIHSALTMNLPLGEFVTTFTHQGHASEFTTMFSVETPFQGFERMSLAVNRAVQNNVVFGVTANIPTGQYKVEINHEGVGAQFTSGITIATPYTGYERMSASVRHSAESESSMTLNIPTGEFEVSMNNRGVVSNFAKTFTLKTPFSGLERVTVSISHDAKDAMNMENTLAIEIPSGEYKITLRNEGSLSAFTSDLILTTPVRGYERLAISMKHAATDYANTDSSLSLELPSGEYTMKVVNEKTATRFASSVTLGSPISGYERLTLAFSHAAVDRNTLQSTLALNTASGEYQIAFDIKKAPKYSVTATLTTPVPGYEKLTASLSHENSDVETSVAINLPSGSYETGITHSKANNKLLSTVFVKTPFTGYERMAITIQHAGRQNIDSSVSIEIPFGNFEARLTKNGTPSRFNSAITIVTPFTGYEELTAEINHSSPSLSSIDTRIAIGYPKGQYSASLNHKGSLLRFTTTMEVTSPHKSWDRVALTIENNSPNANSIEQSVQLDAPCGQYKKTLSHQGNAQQFTTIVRVQTPHAQANLDLEIAHSAKTLSNIKSSATLRTHWGTHGYTLDHEGTANKFQSSLAIKIPFVEDDRMSVSVNHDARSMENIMSSAEAMTPYGTFKYHLTHNGRPTAFKTALNVNTPFSGFEEIIGEIEHSGSSVYSISTSGKLSIKRNVYSVGVSHNGNLRKFTSVLEINTPKANYKLQIDNDVESLQNILTKVMLTMPMGEFSTSVKYNGNPQKFLAALEIETPITSFRRFEITLDHAASSLSNIVSSATALTPYGTYGYSMNHNGNLKRMSSNLVVSTPHTGYENSAFTIEHDARKNLQTTVSFLGSSLALNHRGSLNRMRSSVLLTTPFAGFEQMGISINNKFNDLTKMSSNVAISTPVGEYSYDAQFNGVPRQFIASLEITTPHTELNRMKISADIDVNSMTSLKVSAKLETPKGEYGLRLTHDGSSQSFNCGIEVTTPHTPYNKFAGAINFAKSNTIHLAVEVSSTVVGYERFSMEINHEKRRNGFRSSAEVATSIQRYNRFSTSVEQSGPKVTVAVNTPFNGHESYVLSLEKSQANVAKIDLQTPKGLYTGTVSVSGVMTNFRVEGSLSTPHSGYERFGMEVSHNKDGQTMRTAARLSSPFAKWENFGARIAHDNKDNTLRTSLTAHSTYPGYEEFAAALNHDGHLQDFNTEFQVNTPFNGYKNFGFNLNHGGHMNAFNTRGTIKLPISQIPETVVAISHEGNLLDFKTSGSVEYNNKKIDSEVIFKKTPGRSGNNYEGTLKVNSPYNTLRNLAVTGVHTRNGDIKTGSLDILHNGQQMVDFDYNYNTGSLKNVDIQIRKPYGMSSRVNVGGDKNSADFNWDTTKTDSQAHFELNVKNEVAEKELTIRATLPARTIGFSTTYANAEGRLTHATEVMWDRSAETQASYHIEVSKTTRRSQNIYDGRFSFALPIGGLDATFNHVSQPGRQSTTEIQVQHLNVRSDVVLTSNGFKHTLTAQHPRLPTNLKLQTEGTFENQALDGTIELTFDAETFKFIGHLSDASYYSQTIYNMRAQLTHPNSHLDAAWEGQYKDDSNIKTLYINGKYLTSFDRDVKEASLRATVNKLRNSLEFEVNSPVQNLALTATEKSHDLERGIHSFEIVGTMGEHRIQGDFNVNAEENMVELKLYQDDDLFHVYAHTPSSKEAKAEVYSMTNGERNQHALAAVSVNEDSLISTRFYVSPSIEEEISQIVAQVKNTATYRRLSSILQAAFDTEINQKQAQLTRAIEPFKPAIQFASHQASAISEYAQQTYGTMLEENQFHLKDISNIVKNISAQIRNNVDVETINKVSDVFTSKGKEVLMKLAEVVVNTRQYWQGPLNTAKETIIYARNQLENNKALAWLWDKLMTIDIPDIIAPIEARRDDLLARMQPYLDQLKVWWGELEQRPEMKYIKAHLKRTIARTSWAADYAEIDERIKETIKELHEISLATYRAQLIQKFRDFLQLEKTSWSIWNPETGEIGLDMYWPFHWDDLKHMSKLHTINYQKYVDIAKHVAQKYLPEMPEMKINLRDLYYQYKPSSKPTDWVPPFDTYAAVMGNQHYMTFDKKFYEFNGQCSYLLARDFIDGTFSVVVNYERKNGRPTKKSLTVITNNKQVEVSNDGHVKVDGRLTEMPIAFGNTTISRTGGLVRVDNTLGFTVDCNLPQDRCTVNVTGWYFSKTGGLFGTYNYEPADDFTTAENTRVDTPEALADSWTVGQRCRPENFAVIGEPEPYTDSHRICSALFSNGDSPLRPCFKVVDPEPFQKMCYNDILSIDENRLPGEKDACKAAAFYVDVCNREGVHIRVPSTCVRCEVESLGAEFTEGQNFTIQGDNVPQSADVVFVLEHANCNREVLNKLKDIVDDFEMATKRAGITNNRYSIVGYGASGTLNAPHVRTMDGQIFNTHDKFLLGLDEFTQTSGEEADALSALFYASKLPFRAGVSKSIIIVPCSSCQEASTSYADIEQVLMQKKIHLHVIMEHNFRMNVDKDPVSAYIFGADSQRVYTRKDAGGKDLRGDGELRQQVQMPKDLCVALAMESDGSVFNALQWTQSRPYMQKRFMDVMARLYAQKARPEDCQKCDCVSDEFGVGRAVCKTCQTTRSFYSFLPGFELEQSNEDSKSSSSEESAEVATPRPRMPKKSKRKNVRRLRTN